MPGPWAGRTPSGAAAVGWPTLLPSRWSAIARWGGRARGQAGGWRRSPHHRPAGCTAELTVTEKTAPSRHTHVTRVTPPGVCRTLVSVVMQVHHCSRVNKMRAAPVCPHSLVVGLSQLLPQGEAAARRQDAVQQRAILEEVRAAVPPPRVAGDAGARGAREGLMGGCSDPNHQDGVGVVDSLDSPGCGGTPGRSAGGTPATPRQPHRTQNNPR